MSVCCFVNSITCRHCAHCLSFLSSYVPWTVYFLCCDQCGLYVIGRWMNPSFESLGNVVAQLVERQPRDPMDSMTRGSNPVRSTTTICESFSESKCGADSSVCPIPVCVRTHTNALTYTYPVVFVRVRWITETRLPKGGRGISDVSPLACLESQGCQFGPIFLYLLSCSSA